MNTQDFYSNFAARTGTTDLTRFSSETSETCIAGCIMYLRNIIEPNLSFKTTRHILKTDYKQSDDLTSMAAYDIHQPLYLSVPEQEQSQSQPGVPSRRARRTPGWCVLMRARAPARARRASQQEEQQSQTESAHPFIAPICLVLLIKQQSSLQPGSQHVARSARLAASTPRTPTSYHRPRTAQAPAGATTTAPRTTTHCLSPRPRQP